MQWAVQRALRVPQLGACTAGQALLQLRARAAVAVETAQAEPGPQPSTCDEATATAQLKEVYIARWDQGPEPVFQRYLVDLNTCGPMVLDAVFKAKEADPGLPMRTHCRTGRCHGCMSMVNGLPAVACQTPLDPDTSRHVSFRYLLPPEEQAAVAA